MAYRDIFQDYKAESEDKDICRDICQCDIDLDSMDSDTGVEISEIQEYLWLVSVESCGYAEV